MSDIAWYVAWTLLPLMPSVLLFISLPRNKATVNYASKGLEIKLGGSVAIYFIIFYLMNPIKLGLVKTDFAQDNWQLVASFTDINNNPVSSSQLERVESIPDWNSIPLDDKRIMLALPSVEIRKDKKISIPYRLRLMFKDYETHTISSSDYFNKVDYCDIKWDEKEICLKNLPQLILKKRDTTGTAQIKAAEEIVVN